MCGKPSISVDVDEKFLNIAAMNYLDAIKATAKKCGFIVQYNRPYVDVYCSKRCAL